METNLKTISRKCNTTAKNMQVAEVQANPGNSLLLIIGRQYLINSTKLIYEGLSFNEQYHVLRYLDEQLQFQKPLLVPVADSTPAGEDQYILMISKIK